MKTNNLSLELMVPSQIHKDVLYNESIFKIDSFINQSVNGFMEKAPKDLNIGEKYIILTGADKNKIYYRSHESKALSVHQPSLGMVVYSINDGKTIYFSEKGWVNCQSANVSASSSNASSNKEERALKEPLPKLSRNPTNNRFKSVNGQYEIQSITETQYLYLSHNTELIADRLELPEVTLVIKQAHDNQFRLTCSHNILWSNTPASSFLINKNCMLMVKLYALPETDHYLGSILGINYSYDKK